MAILAECAAATTDATEIPPVVGTNENVGTRTFGSSVRGPMTRMNPWRCIRDR